MKKFYAFAAAIGILLGVSAILAAQDGYQTSYDPWPREFKSDNTTYKMYQPQFDDWDGFTLTAHAAVSVQAGTETAKVTYGVANYTVDTVVDKTERVVDLENLRFTGVNFPSDPDNEDTYLAALKESAPIHLKTMSLDRLEANLAVIAEQKKGASHKLNNAPPKIIFSNVPSILVYIDGDPVFAPVKGTSLQRVVNTRVLILKDNNGKLYLHVFDGYMESNDISGKWAVSQNPPAGAGTAVSSLSSLQKADLLEGDPDPETKAKPSLRSGQAPRVYVSLVPAELIVTDGEADYLPIEGTNLLYVSNTSANIFKYMTDQKLYVLISGRWFRAPAESGPWEYVSGKNLPRDFSKIPDESPKEGVKASVPGTRQAEEAVISNNIPTTIRVPRNTASPVIDIDGIPDMRPVEGTGLYYVFNCSVPIIKSGQEWFALYDGVWFTAPAVRGPWIVAVSVPADIYSIPTSSPLHYVTYVRVYHTDADNVYSGYTAGYFGTVVSPDGTVVFGTGYDYPCYIGTDVWYSPVITYGYGCDMVWTPWFGWGYSFGFGWGYRYYWYHPPTPNWGPYYIWNHHFRRGFRPWDVNTSGIVFRHLKRQPGNSGWTGGPVNFGRSYNSTTGRLISGGPNSVNNVFTGWVPGSASGGVVSGGQQWTSGGKTGGQQQWTTTGGQGTGTSGASRFGTAGTAQNQAGSANTNRFGQGGAGTQKPETIYVPPAWSGNSNNNMYATRSGQVYTYEETSKGGKWRNVNTDQQIDQREQRREYNELNEERSARHIGNSRTHTFQNFQNQGFHSEGGGGGHGGGGWSGGGGGGGGWGHR